MPLEKVPGQGAAVPEKEPLHAGASGFQAGNFALIRSCPHATGADIFWYNGLCALHLAWMCYNIAANAVLYPRK